MVLNLLEKGHSVVAYNRSSEKVRGVEGKGAEGAYSIKEFFKKIPKKRIIWLMVKAGKPVDILISKLNPFLEKGDIIIDGGNSYFEDSIRRYNSLKKKGIHFLDCGTSGGISGARHGACMMIGGDKLVFKSVEKLFKDMCVKDGYGYMGRIGMGHFVKMVHNGIEYGMMGAIAEGMEAIREYSPESLKEASRVFAHGSIVEGRLMNWLFSGVNSGDFESILGEVPYGETEDEMKKLEGVSEMPILHQARLMRVKTRKKPSFKGKIISMLRNQFGGHSLKK